MRSAMPIDRRSQTFVVIPRRNVRMRVAALSTFALAGALSVARAESAGTSAADDATPKGKIKITDAGGAGSEIPTPPPAAAAGGGWSELQGGQAQEAARKFFEGYTANPSSEEAKRGLAAALGSMNAQGENLLFEGRTEDAEGVLQEAYRLNPGGPGYSELASVQRRTLELLQVAKATHEPAPVEAGAADAKGKVEFNEPGKTTEKSEYERLVESGQHRLNKASYEGALDLFAQAKAKEPERVDAVLGMDMTLRAMAGKAKLLAQNGETLRAEELLQKGFEADPNNAALAAADKLIAQRRGVSRGAPADSGTAPAPKMDERSRIEGTADAPDASPSDH